jgi:hypothetical protein
VRIVAARRKQLPRFFLTALAIFIANPIKVWQRSTFATVRVKGRAKLLRRYGGKDAWFTFGAVEKAIFRIRTSNDRTATGGAHEILEFV